MRDTNINNYVDFASPGGLLAPNQWSHVAFTFDSVAQTVALYVNGVNVASKSFSVPIHPQTDVAVNLGYRPDTSLDLFAGRRHVGKLDEVSIYNRALSTAEIQAIYEAGSFGKCRTLLAPSIITQPTNQTVQVGDAASFIVGATGDEPLSYQWWFNGSALSGGTNSSLTLANVQLSEAGAYSVSVSNAAGSTLSSNAVLTVLSAGSNCAPVPAGLVSWWKGEGNADEAVSGNSGVLEGNVAFAPGMVGQGFLLNGTNSYIRVTNSPSLSLSQEVTIELWFKNLRTDSYAYGLIAKRGSETAPVNYGINVTPGGLQAYFRDPSASGVYETAPYLPVPTPLVWHHLAGTWQQVSTNTVEVKTYLDGQLVQTGSFPGRLADSVNNYPVTIGVDTEYPGYDYLQGIIDEVSLYNRALSATEIQAVYNAGSAGKCTAAIAPLILLQPTNQTAVVGGSVMFNVGAGGTPPFSYQWRFDGTSVPGATNASLILQNVQPGQAGTYSVVVTNSVGTAISGNALLNVTYGPSLVQIGQITTSSGTITVPVELVANGNENALGFSMDFDPSLFSFTSVFVGSGASGAALFLNTNSVGAGKVGIALALPTATTFAPGTQELVEVTFIRNIATNEVSTSFSFGDQPIGRQVSDAQANRLSATYAGSQVPMTPTPIEGDVALRPNGDEAVTIIDWVQEGRYVARLDFPTNVSEFQRADCAPRATLGDGQINLADWVQVGRYMAGLDPLTVAGGPTSEIPLPAVSVMQKADNTARQVRVGNAVLIDSQAGTVSVYLATQGNENAVAFSFYFDPGALAYTGSSPGADAAGATINSNVSDAGSGQLGFILALSPGNNFAAGTRELLKLSFRAATPTSATYPIALGDQPVQREVVDTSASTLTAAYFDGSIAVNPLPALAIAQSGQNIILSWPQWATNFVLEQASGSVLPSLGWTNAPVTPIITNGANVVTLTVTGQSTFYRLGLP